MYLYTRERDLGLIRDDARAAKKGETRAVASQNKNLKLSTERAAGMIMRSLTDEAQIIC